MLRSLSLVSLALALVVLLAAPAAAHEAQTPAAKAPPKHPRAYPAPAAGELRQGGDTLLDAVPLTIPVIDLAGTTEGYVDDYDEGCPYPTSTSPDVVYLLSPETSLLVSIDLFGSAYDTKVYVYDEDLALVACNDDYYPDYTSFLERVPLVGGVQYYVVIDGYSGDAGSYLLDITEFVPCELSCLPYAEDEDEPPLADGYVDLHNGGCNTGPDGPFQTWLAPALCGRSGWYVDADGFSVRDTDWFTLTIPADGVLEIAGNAEEPTYMFELGPQDCESVGVEQLVTIGPCNEESMAIVGEPGAPVWFWVGPTTFEPPGAFEGHEYDYWLVYLPAPSPVEATTLTEIKGLFR